MAGGTAVSLRQGRAEFRLEDEPLIRGEGCYTADRRFDGEAHLVVVRSPFAAGRIALLDVGQAAAAPGVLAVLTAADLPPGTRGFSPGVTHQAPEGGAMFVPPYLPLSDGAVRYVGDPVAAVVARTLAEAEAAAEFARLEVEEQEPLVDPLAAAAGAPVWPQRADNTVFRVERGDRAAVSRILAAAPHVVRRTFPITRVVAAAMEPRVAIGLHDAAADTYTLYVGTQGVHRLALSLAAAMGIEPARLRVISGDTGGAFGIKNAAYPEYALVLIAAQRLGRPVRWQSSRVESFQSDSHAREQVMEGALAFDDDGRFLALDVVSTAALGAYLGPATTLPMVNNIGGLAGVYRTPAIAVRVDGVLVNTQNVAAYRGAGRPEATYVIERLADLAAVRLGLDPAEIRRRNFIAPAEMPYTTPLGSLYDSGDFPAVMERALRAADWAGFPARRQEAQGRGKLRGIGISCPIEIANGPSGRPNPEYAGVSVDADGVITAALGTGDTGMGHRTTFSNLLADRFGVTIDRIRIVAGDTGLVANGFGSFGSRTSQAATTAAIRASDAVIAKARALAAGELEASPEDLEFVAGEFRIVGTDRSVSLAALSAQTPLAAEDYSSAGGATFPNGCHVCEVEIDPETGTTRIVSYVVVDDVGTVLNEAIVEGQLHGGVAQGIGQALMERIVYEEGSGQLLTASFMDYAMPRADDLPPFHVETHPVPTPNNVLGAKGAGEAGVVGSLAAVIGAVSDALAPLGIDHIDMPASPERVWAAIRAARGAVSR
jgi:carbon-monoxide dehydrogenase large subunit